VKRLVLGIAALTALATPAAILAAAPSNAATSTPVYTHITTPSDGATIREPDQTGNSVVTPVVTTITGVASPGITKVWIYCLHASAYGGGVGYDFNLDPVAVDPDSGQFQTTTTRVSTQGCQLRALPDGVSLTSNLAAFTGPVIYSIQFLRALVDPTKAESSTNPVIDFTVYGGEGNGSVAMWGSDRGVSNLAYAPRPTLRRINRVSQTALGVDDESDALIADGHDALVPDQANELIFERKLDLVPPALTVELAVAPNGDETVTESEPLVSCNGSGDPDTALCTQLVPVGVRLDRTLHYFRNGQQVQVRDTFVSTDGHQHSVKSRYESYMFPLYNQPGIVIPGHGTNATGYTATKHLTGFGSGSKTLLVRSDRYASANEEQATTEGLTWSRPPSSIDIIPNATLTQMRLTYFLTVPAHSRAGLGFAISGSTATSEVVQLGRDASAVMMSKPAVTSPRNGAKTRKHRVLVTGRVAFGANGFPTRVTVNGHRGTLTVLSATSARFRVAVPVARGTHTLSVVAVDSGGNTTRTAVRVHRR
jgi:hypothetical protein